MTDAAKSELSEPGTLRVGINLGNILLVTGKKPNGTSTTASTMKNGNLV